MLEKTSKDFSGGRYIFDLLRETLAHKEQRNRIATATLSEKQARQEHKTIKINLGRQMGHTTAAVSLFNEYENVLIITSNEQSAQLTREKAGINSSIYAAAEYKRHNITARILSEVAVLKTGSAYWATTDADGSANVPDIVILDNASYSKLNESTLWELFPKMQYLIMLQ